MPKTEDPNGNDRVWSEIEEILERKETRERAPIRIARPTRPARARRPGISAWSLTPEKLIVVGILLMVIAAIARQMVLPLTIIGFAIAGFGYYMVLTRRRGSSAGSGKVRRSSSSSSEPKYWRGKRVQEGDDSEQPPGRILQFPGSSKRKRRRKPGEKSEE